MQLLPAEVRQCYAFDFFRQGGATHALLEKAVIGMQSSSALHREIMEVRTNCCTAVGKYGTADGGFEYFD